MNKAAYKLAAVKQGRRHGVDWGLPEVVPEIDANPASFNWGNVGGGGDGGR